MHVRVVQQILPPRVQDRNEADLGAQVLRIGGDRAQCPGAGAKQQVVEHAFVLVAAQRCHDRPSIRRFAIKLRLPCEETPNVLRLDRGHVDGALAETSRQQSRDDPQGDAPRLRRQASHSLHILAVTAQFLVYRCCADRWHCDDTASVQNREQMPQRRPMVTPIVM